MGVNSNQYLQGINQTTGTGAPVHSAVAGDRYTDTATGITYQYTTSWQTVSYSAGGLTYFTEAQATTGVNSTSYADSLTSVASTTNADFVIRPKGNGAILAMIPDGSETGGNKRGTYALDFQRIPVAGGQGATYVASGASALILSGTYNTASGAQSVILNGTRQSATNDSTTIINGYVNGATGIYATVINGDHNNATGQGATVINGSYNTAGGNYSLSGGYSGNSSSGSYSMAYGGTGNISSGSRSLAFGEGNTSSGFYSVALNANNTSSGDYSIAMGLNATTSGTYGKSVLGGGGATLGSAQKGALCLTARTTGNTPTELAFNSTVINASYQMTVSDNNGMRVRGSIIAKQSGSVNISAWDFDYVIVRGVGIGTTSVVTSNVNVVTNIPAWGTPTITADTARGYASIKVTGATTTNIQWTATIDSAEVIYA